MQKQQKRERRRKNKQPADELKEEGLSTDEELDDNYNKEINGKIGEGSFLLQQFLNYYTN